MNSSMIFFVTLIFLIVLAILIFWFVNIDKGKNDNIGATLEVEGEFTEARLRVQPLTEEEEEDTEDNGGQVVIGKSLRELKYSVALSGLSSPITRVSLYQNPNTFVRDLQYTQDEEGNFRISGAWSMDEQKEKDPILTDRIMEGIRNGQTFLIVFTQKFPRGEGEWKAKITTN